MRFDDEIILIKEEVLADDYGNQKKVKKERSILCHVASIGRQEFYQASNSNYKPEFVFVVHPFEYEGEQVVKYQGKEYGVIRTFENKPDGLDPKRYKNDYTGYLEIVAGGKVGLIQ